MPDEKKFIPVKARVRASASGKCVDGRTIPAEHLAQMVEDYNPDELLRADVRLLHMDPNWTALMGLDLGYIPSITTELGSSGRTFLLADMMAGRDTVQLASENPNWGLSIGYAPEFPPTGRAYLHEISLTQTPAVTGVSRLKFETVGDANKFEPVTWGEWKKPDGKVQRYEIHRFSFDADSAQVHLVERLSAFERLARDIKTYLFGEAAMALTKEELDEGLERLGAELKGHLSTLASDLKTHVDKALETAATNAAQTQGVALGAALDLSPVLAKLSSLEAALDRGTPVPAAGHQDFSGPSDGATNQPGY